MKSQICSKDKCTGCSACANICPHSAIKMVADGCGYVFPLVDSSLCVECDLCVKICPNNKDIECNNPISANVAFAKNTEEQRTSTSGGMASVLSRTILNKGGVVYGCSSIDCWNVKHIRIENPDDVVLLKGSKYVQSKIGATYQSIKQDLQSGKIVLFIGTPCQVSGLYSFLGKKPDLLYTVDLVCHGVPSQEILSGALLANKCVSQREKYSVEFRKKTNSGKSLYGLYLKNKEGKYVLDETYPNGVYTTAFLIGLFYRESCYQCKYASINRVADITLGDYWDEEGQFSGNDSSRCGLSTVIASSSKGMDLLNMSKDSFQMYPVDIDAMKRRHNQLQHPFPKHKDRHVFVENFERFGFSKACNKALKRYYRNRNLSRVASLIKKIPGTYKIYCILKEWKNARK